MKKKQIRKRLKEQLTKNPNISAACNNVGISRQTYYRWVYEDESFKLEMDTAMTLGVEHIHDMAESQVIKGIQNGNQKYIMYWLNKRSNAYKNKVEYRPHIVVLKSIDEEKYLKNLENYLKEKGFPKYIESETWPDRKY